MAAVSAEKVSRLHDQAAALGAALEVWDDRHRATDKPVTRPAGSAAVDAIDAALRDLHAWRGRLAREISEADAAGTPSRYWKGGQL